MKAEFRASAAHYSSFPGAGRMVRALAIDFTSPTEPLRNLPHDLEHFVVAMVELQAMLTKRFNG